MNSPEVCLWSMVLIQSIFDLFEIRHGSGAKEKQMLAWAARGWFKSTQMHVGSFLWVAAVLDFDAPTLRKKVLALDRAAVRSAVHRAPTVRGDRRKTTPVLQRRHNKPLLISKIHGISENYSITKIICKAKKNEELESTPRFSEVSGL